MRGLCPEEINRLSATGVQIEAYDSQIVAYRSRICEQDLFFVVFCGFTPNFMKRWGRRLFFLVLALEFVENRKMTTKICGHFWTEDFSFFFVFTLGFVENRKNFEIKTRVCGNFWTEDLLFFWFLPFSFDSHSRIHINKLHVPPQSRYPGARPASVAYKLIFVILLYSPSCFGEETEKEPFSLRVKLPRLVYHILWSLHTVPFYC